jgi:hypothetical protein
VGVRGAGLGVGCPRSVGGLVQSGVGVINLTSYHLGDK